jgi:hypothetical protein
MSTRNWSSLYGTPLAVGHVRFQAWVGAAHLQCGLLNGGTVWALAVGKMMADVTMAAPVLGP